MGYRTFNLASRFGYFLAMVLTVLTFLMMVSHALYHPPRHGLLVSTGRVTADAQPTFGIEPILVTVRRSGWEGPATYFVNSREVAWEELTGVVLQEIATRPPDWPVYFRAEGDIEWGIAAAVIDRLKGLGVGVALAPNRTATTDRGRPNRIEYPSNLRQ